jgi:Anti-sigma factor NepR
VQGDDKDGKPEQDKAKMQKSDSSAGPEPVAGTGQKRNLPLDTQIQAHIGRRLMAVYDEILQQPVPDRFRLLLDELDQKTKKRDGEPGEGGEGH